MEKTKEQTEKAVKKSLFFEESGETFSIEISLKNVSPNIDISTIVYFLDTLFQHAKEDLNTMHQAKHGM